MANDFISQMAQMIAAARPPVAQGQARPVVIPSRSAGMGSFGGTERATSMNVDIGSILRLAGYRTPEEKRQEAVNLLKTFSYISPEARKKWVLQNQNLIKSAGEKGLLPVTVNEDGTYDINIDEIARQTILGIPVSQYTVESGISGEGARQKFIEAQVKKTWPEDTLALEKRQRLANIAKTEEEAKKIAEEAKTAGTMRDYYANEAAKSAAETDLFREKVKLYPAEANSVIALNKSTVRRNLAEASKAYAEIDALKGKLPKALETAHEQALRITKEVSELMQKRPLPQDTPVMSLYLPFSSVALGTIKVAGGGPDSYDAIHNIIKEAADTDEAKIPIEDRGALNLGLGILGSNVNLVKQRKEKFRPYVEGWRDLLKRYPSSSPEVYASFLVSAYRTGLVNNPEEIKGLMEDLGLSDQGKQEVAKAFRTKLQQRRR